MKDKSSPIDFDAFPITKLPPGEAYGARDLTRWSHNRAVGSSGAGSTNTKPAIRKCHNCGFECQVIVSRYAKRNDAKRFPCRNCGKRRLSQKSGRR